MQPGPMDVKDCVPMAAIEKRHEERCRALLKNAEAREVRPVFAHPRSCFEVNAEKY